MTATLDVTATSMTVDSRFRDAGTSRAIVTASPRTRPVVATYFSIPCSWTVSVRSIASAARALGSFPPGSVHLILGGTDKGADWAELVERVRVHARRVLLVGQSSQALRVKLAGTVPLVECETIARAVRAGFDGARADEVVLLAPGCASFDQYRNFEERGDDFRRSVLRLVAGEQADA